MWEVLERLAPILALEKAYELEEEEIVKKKLVTFHQWAGQKCTVEKDCRGRYVIKPEMIIVHKLDGTTEREPNHDNLLLVCTQGHVAYPPGYEAQEMIEFTPEHAKEIRRLAKERGVTPEEVLSDIFHRYVSKWKRNKREHN